MREINKTIYEMLKMKEPEEGINVSQIITDDLIKKSETGEAKADGGASAVLNEKAQSLGNSNLTSTRKNILKATEKSHDKSQSHQVKTKQASATNPKKKVATKRPTPAPKNRPAPPQKQNPLIPVIIAIIILGVGAYVYLELFS
ncbi:MAG: hypothetical protein QF441_01890 [Bacteriovoracaceae bacterium]|jgi:hypothetical protein|nr:hypothetical protein [Bacteriovoracaceae bacterium]